MVDRSHHQHITELAKEMSANLNVTMFAVNTHA